MDIIFSEKGGDQKISKILDY